MEDTIAFEESENNWIPMVWHLPSCFPILFNSTYYLSVPMITVLFLLGQLNLILTYELNVYCIPNICQVHLFSDEEMRLEEL